MNRRRISLITGLILLGACSAIAQEQSATVTLNKAIAELRAELKAGKLREKSDFFGKKPPAELTPEAILVALEQRMSGGRSTEAYIKWQLLSAIPGHFPEDLAPRALAIYRRAPVPFDHPGRDRQMLERQVNGISKEELAAANEEFTGLLTRSKAANAPILNYRAALFERLPSQYDTLLAGLADLQSRSAAGLNIDKFLDTVSARLRSWALTAPREQLNVIGNRVLEIRSLATEKGVRPYREAYDDKGVKKWREDSIVEAKKINGLVDFLRTTVASPAAGGLKFKDDPK